ncbi:AAA family ATPase [Lactobacillus kalixensis]|uniref:AAA family ATPase n=1 Tax=Lactobacillus kalixensis TaxID=227944 RepID=UPI00070988D1
MGFCCLYEIKQASIFSNEQDKGSIKIKFYQWFYEGPPGIGKTTFARVIAEHTKKDTVKIISMSMTRLIS